MSIFHHAEVEQEYQRWREKLPYFGYCGGLTYDDVLMVHFVLADMFYGKNRA